MTFTLRTESICKKVIEFAHIVLLDSVCPVSDTSKGYKEGMVKLPQLTLCMAVCISRMCVQQTYTNHRAPSCFSAFPISMLLIPNNNPDPLCFYCISMTQKNAEKTLAKIVPINTNMMYMF